MAGTDSASLGPLVLALGVGVCTLLFNGIPSSKGGSNLPRWGVRLPIFLTCASYVWLRLVSSVVPEPYLDEVFHIPQAQKYCQGKFREWDDKITTPPGLYMFSAAVQQGAQKLGLERFSICDPPRLRAINCVGVITVSYLALLCRQAIEARLHETRSTARVRAFSQYALHTAVNIGLFPVLFFFSGLYYTDVLSTAMVLCSYLNHLHRVGSDVPSILSDILAIALGIATLFMRQTNVFWVVIFMGGLEVAHAVKTLRPQRVDQPEATSLCGRLQFYATRYAAGDIHDLPLQKAYPDDALFTALSIAIAAIANPLRVVRQIWPYVIVLTSFAAFVQWNGGVVLGDKSNHVATIHLAQMLYIWPFFAFFSLPLLVPCAFSFFDMVASLTRRSTKTDNVPQTTSWPLKAFAAFFNSKILWPIYLIATTALSAAVVRFNTIIHPFTLADNRHYMFYIFRYTIRRGSFIKLGLVLPYTVSRWMFWDALGGFSSWTDNTQQPAPFTSHPFWVSSNNKERRQSNTPFPREPHTGKSTTSDITRKANLEKDPLFLSRDSVSTSTGLVFLLATTLSLITAPLVEPRYFIIPYVMWRLMVPAWHMGDHVSSPLGNRIPFLRHVAAYTRGYDVRLFAETAWYMLINVATGYMFLYKPYVWKAEDGTVLEAGNLQRFMW